MNSNPQKLDRLSRAAQLRKTNLENRLLAQQLTKGYRRLEMLKVIASASGLIIALVAVVGGLASIGGWLLDQEKSREIRIDERLDRALAMLADPTAGKRLAAISSLRSFLVERNDARNVQVLLALSGALFVEDSVRVRSAISSAIDDVSPDLVSKYVLDKTIRVLVESNRGLVRETEFWGSRPDKPIDVELDKKGGATLQAAADAIASLVRKGGRVRDMNGIYLGGVKLQEVDLSETIFDNAILAWSDFSKANLRDASFDGADLQQAKFVSADLRNARLIVSKRDRFAFNGPHLNYVEQQMLRTKNGQMQVEMPDFRCADLRDADFSGHPLFAIVSDTIWDTTPIPYFTVASGSFEGTRLQRANFENVETFGLQPANNSEQPEWPFVVAEDRAALGLTHGKRDLYFRVYFRILPNSDLTTKAALFSKALNNISANFRVSDWNDAKLPKAVRQWLEKHPPAENASSGKNGFCEASPSTRRTKLRD